MTTKHPVTGKRSRVVVIGGGYAGANAANRLQLRTDVDVMLVNPRPQFVERIRLHQLVARTGAVLVDYNTLLSPEVHLIVDSATSIDAAERQVVLASGATLDYDYLIYAVGSTGVPAARVPGAAQFAFPIAEFEQADRLRDALEKLPPTDTVTVVGAGLTGIETAAELAEQGLRVRLVCGGVLAPTMSEPARRSVSRRLARLGVEIFEAATVVEVRPDTVVLDGGTVLPSPVTIWTAGFGVPDLATESGLRTDALGRLLTDETLTSVDDERIVAGGDAAAPSDRPLRMSCQAAIPLGAQAANTVLARIAGTDPAVLNQAFVGSNASLGRRAATIQFARRDDTPVNVFVGGRLGAAVKKLVSRGTLWGIRLEARKPGYDLWLRGGTRSTMPKTVPGP